MKAIYLFLILTTLASLNASCNYCEKLKQLPSHNNMVSQNEEVELCKVLRQLSPEVNILPDESIHALIRQKQHIDVKDTMFIESFWCKNSVIMAEIIVGIGTIYLLTKNKNVVAAEEPITNPSIKNDKLSFNDFWNKLLCTWNNIIDYFATK